MKYKIFLAIVFFILVISLVSAGIFDIFNSGSETENNIVSKNIVYTPTSQTTDNLDGTKTLTLYSGVRFVAEDGKWKEIEKANSLKNSSIKCIVTKGKDDPEVECLDYNYTSIKIDVKDKNSYPIKIYSKNNTLKSENPEKNLDIETIDIDFGDILHIGKESTTIELVGNNDTADLFFYGIIGEDMSFLSALKFNISLIPIGSNIVNADVYLYIRNSDESSNYGTNFRVGRIVNQTWDETNVPENYIFSIQNESLQDTIDASSGLKMSGQNDAWLGTTVYYNVTDIIKTDFNDNNLFSSLLIADNGSLDFSNYVYNLDESEGLISGYSIDSNLVFVDREGTESSATYSPYLNITYSDSNYETIILQGTEKTYDGVLIGDERYDTAENYIIGKSAGFYLTTFIEFDTSELDDNLNITSIRLNQTVISTNSPLVRIIRLNNTRIYGNPNFMDNTTGNTNLNTYITNAVDGYYVDGTGYLNALGERNITMPELFVNDTKDQLADGYIGFGFRIYNSDESNNYSQVNSSESLTPPQLIITYVRDKCEPPETGDWEIDVECYLNDKAYSINGNISITSTGILNISGISNFTLTGTKQNIRLFDGGKFVRGSGFKIIG